MKLRSKDIAKQLGVSPATVSLVLNNRPGVGDELRQKILQVLDENGYTINKKGNKPVLFNNIYFIIYKKHGKVVSDTPFFSVLTESIHRAARNNEYNLVVTYIDETQDDVIAVIEDINSKNPAGVLLLATEMHRKDLIPFKKLNCPLLIVDRQFDSENLNMVCIDNGDGVYKAVQHMHSLNYQTIGYLNSKVWIDNFEQRLRWFRSYAFEYDMPLHEGNIFQLNPTIEGAYNDMKAYLLRCKDMPKTLFAANDIIAIGACKALTEAGYRIPEDVSIIGFDDMSLCELCSPPLTTIHVYNDQLGAVAVKRLCELINGEELGALKILIGTKLVKRQSA